MNLKLLNKFIPKISFLFVAITISIISCKQSSDKQLPIFNPSDMDSRVVDKSMKDVNVNHTVTDFNLINQNGEKVTQEDYKGKIYVADFFFTSCTTICPMMTAQTYAKTSFETLAVIDFLKKLKVIYSRNIKSN